MGLVRELVDEMLPLPKQMDSTFERENEVISIYRFSYAFINLVFQSIDCLLIPMLTVYCFIGVINFGWLNWVVIILGGIASIFSLGQSLYYFISPPEKYLNPILGRFLGETAVGAFIASIFKIRIITLIT